MNKYRKIKELGEGGFGKAFLVSRKDTGEKFVIKEIKANQMTREEKQEAKKEMEILSNMKHQHIVKYEDSFEENGKLYIVMEHCDGGDLRGFIEEQNGVLLDENIILSLFIQLCLALKHIHDGKTLHRDIKPENIFLTKKGSIKMGDFGIARVLNYTLELVRTGAGTWFYMSPEILEDKPYSYKSDMWSLGCVLYELLTLNKAFEAGRIPAIVNKITKGEYKPVPSQYSNEVRNLLSQLLRTNPEERPSINSILRGSFLQPYIRQFLTPEQLQEEFGNLVLHQTRPEEVEVLIGQIKKMSEESIYWKYLPNLDNINKYQREFTQLICRAVEENQMEAVKQKLSTKKGLQFETRLSTNTQIPLINQFLAYVDPHLLALYLHLPSNETFNFNDFDRWLQVVGNLTNKIRLVVIDKITTSISTTNLATFIGNIEGRLQIFYRENESHEKVENMNKIMQNIINKNPLTEMYISTSHNYHKNYIKQQHDPRMTSSNQVTSLITESPLIANNKSLKWIPSSDEMLNNLSRHIDGKGFVFDIFVTTIAEVRKLNKFLQVVKPSICWIKLYLPRNSKRDDVKLLCDVITGNNAKIGYIELFNLNKSNYHDDVIKLASKVDRKLDLRFTDHRSAEEKNVLEARFQSLKSKAQIDLHFRSDARVINKK